MKLVMAAWRKHTSDSLSNDRKVAKLMQVLRKHQKFHAFRKFIQKTRWEIQLKDRDKIEGAYLLLKRFKNRLKQLDHALEKINQRKVDKEEMQELARSVDPMRT